jgi:hypothetical protein
LGSPVADDLSPLTARLEEVEPNEYYGNPGHDGNSLRVPSDLDESICCYRNLSEANRAKFNRAMFWTDMASRHWDTSLSSSFASLVSAVEALTQRGITHRVYCNKCDKDVQHDSPGPTELFRSFFETYAPGSSLTKRRNQMYDLRSGILHGSDLMQMDRTWRSDWTHPG